MSSTSPAASVEDLSPLGGSLAAPALESDAFRALLTPHRSLSPRGFKFLMLGIGGVSLATGFLFLLSGAWPVLCFFGLDVALVYLAFQLNYRAARLHETVDLGARALVIKRIYPSGKEESWTFHPYWARLAVEENEDTGRTELTIRSHGRELVFGHFLSDEEKHDFADALGGALRSVRLGRAAA